MCSPAPTRINTFLLGGGNSIYWKAKVPPNDLQWTAWVGPNGAWSYEPVSISRVLNQISVFMVGTDHTLQQSNMDITGPNTLGPWTNLGGKLLGVPAVANCKGTLHIFHIGTDHGLYHKQWDGVGYTPIEGFVRIGGPFIHNPTAISTGRDKVTVFTVGITDGRLYLHNWEESKGWGEAKQLPGVWVGNPSAVSDQEGCWDVFGIDLDGKINHVSSKHDVQSELQTISGLFHTVDVVSWGPGRLDLITWGYTNTVYHRSYDKGEWGGWEDLGGGIAYRPTPVSHSPGALSVLAVGTDCALYVKARDPNGVWSPWTNIQGTVLCRPG